MLFGVRKENSLHAGGQGPTPDQSHNSLRGQRRTGNFSTRPNADKSYWPGDDHEVVVTDVRSLSEPPTIERNGFTMLNEQTGVRDFLDARQIQQVLHPEAVGLAKRLNGAAHAIAFGPVARSDSPRQQPESIAGLWRTRRLWAGAPSRTSRDRFSERRRIIG